MKRAKQYKKEPPPLDSMPTSEEEMSVKKKKEYVPLSSRRTIIDSRKKSNVDMTYVSFGASMPPNSYRCAVCDTGYSRFGDPDQACPQCGSKEIKPYTFVSEKKNG